MSYFASQLQLLVVLTELLNGVSCISSTVGNK